MQSAGWDSSYICFYKKCGLESFWEIPGRILWPPMVGPCSVPLGRQGWERVFWSPGISRCALGKERKESGSYE